MRAHTHAHIRKEKKCRTQKAECSFGSVAKVLAAQRTSSLQQGYLGLSGRRGTANLPKSVGKAKKQKKEKKMFGLQKMSRWSQVVEGTSLQTQRLSRIQKEAIPETGLPPLMSSDLMTLNLTVFFPATLFFLPAPWGSALKEKTPSIWRCDDTNVQSNASSGRAGTARSPCRLLLLAWLFPPRFVFRPSKRRGEGRDSLSVDRIRKFHLRS